MRPTGCSLPLRPCLPPAVPAMPGPPSPSDPSSSSAAAGLQRSTWRTNDRDVTDFGQERLDDRIRMHRCDQCSKPVLARYRDYHRRESSLRRYRHVSRWGMWT